MQETGAKTEKTVFVDGLLENLVEAHSLGFKTIRNDSFATVERLLHNYCGDPVAMPVNTLKALKLRVGEFLVEGWFISFVVPFTTTISFGELVIFSFQRKPTRLTFAVPGPPLRLDPGLTSEQLLASCSKQHE